jgi:hypothetical protein
MGANLPARAPKKGKPAPRQICCFAGNARFSGARVGVPSNRQLQRIMAAAFSGEAGQLINLFTMARQSGRLKDGKPASYDEATMHRVRAMPSGAGRKLGFAVVFSAMFVGVALLNVESNRMEADAIRVATAKTYQWVNPVTGMSVMVAGQWKLGSMAGENGVQLPTFTTSTEHAVVVLGHETFPDVTMHSYIQALMTNLSKTIQFADGGIADTSAGRPAWTLTGPPKPTLGRNLAAPKRGVYRHTQTPAPSSPIPPRGWGVPEMVVSRGKADRSISRNPDRPPPPPGACVAVVVGYLESNPPACR